ncbi:hypothetical protein A3733_23550, partial [Pseudoalteromonas shioyasakiensis]
ILFCLYGPLLAGLFGQLVNLKFVSPTFMASLDNIYYTIVFCSLCIGFCLLLAKYSIVKESFKNKIIAHLTLILSILYSCLMFFGIGLLILFNIMFNSNTDYVHQEQAFGYRTFYVYTSDPGAFGTAHHYVYLKCPASFNRYELELITNLSWMKDYKMSLEGDNLIFENDSEQGKTVLDVSEFYCK